MNAAFNEVLSLLRRSKGVSQRKAAADLHISQALLSHYENGIREPGLDFVKRACDYYEVSADFLLGRTSLQRAGERDVEDTFAAVADGAPGDSVELLAGAMTVIFKLTEQLGGEELTAEASRYMGTSAYRIFRYPAGLDPDRETDRLTVPDGRVGCLADVEMRLSEMRLLDELDRLRGDEGIRAVNEKFMRTEFPLLCNYLEELLSRMDKRIAQHIVKETP